MNSVSSAAGSNFVTTLLWPGPARSPETRARQLLETCFSLRDARSIGRIELVPRIAGVIHFDLYGHPALLARFLIKTARTPSVPRQCEVDWSPF